MILNFLQLHILKFGFLLYLNLLAVLEDIVHDVEFPRTGLNKHVPQTGLVFMCSNDCKIVFNFLQKVCFIFFLCIELFSSYHSY